MKTDIFAHRGASKYAPENTMPAFNLAYQMGAEGIETDVQLTKDDIPVLIHDENVRRTSNGTGFVQDYTLRELQQLDAGTWFSKQFKDTRIPSLEEFLRWAKTKKLLINLELKNNVLEYKGMEKIVNQYVNFFHLSDSTIITSFNSDSVMKYNTINCSISTGLLTSQKSKDLPSYAKDLGADSLHIKYRLLNRKLVRQCQQHNINLRVYTVNQPSQMTRCMKLGCDGIITDVPDIALKQRDKLTN
nr:glycerophosphodiester phosphodiesterase [Aquibacillus sediminis]